MKRSFSYDKFFGRENPFEDYVRQKVCKVLGSLLLIWMVIFIAPISISIFFQNPEQGNNPGSYIYISGLVLIMILAFTSCCCVGLTKGYRMRNMAHIFLLSLGVSCTLSGISMFEQARPFLWIAAGIVIGITAILNSIVFALPEKCLNRYLFSWVSVTIVLVLLLVAIALIIVLALTANVLENSNATIKGIAITIPSIFIIIFTFVIFNEIAEMRMVFSNDSDEEYTSTYFVFNLLFSTFQLLIEIVRLFLLADG